MTRHSSPQRIRRVRALVDARNGPGKFDNTLAMIPASVLDDYLDALCLAWLGPLQRRHTRSDKGQFRVMKGREWSYADLRCAQCGEPFLASRIDARYCSARCRQRAYRQRAETMECG